MSEKMKFTWSLTEDRELYENGVCVAWVAGSREAIQNFVKRLSYKIGSKCDFAYDGGRAHIDVYKDAYENACTAMADTDFMLPFIVPYSDESRVDGTYFEILELNGQPVAVDNNIKIKEEVNVKKLIEKFTDMADRGSLLTGDVSQEDLLVQIIGTIVRVAIED